MGSEFPVKVIAIPRFLGTHGEQFAFAGRSVDLLGRETQVASEIPYFFCFLHGKRERRGSHPPDLGG